MNKSKKCKHGMLPWECYQCDEDGRNIILAIVAVVFILGCTAFFLLGQWVAS